jgi:hypothetical protein
MFTDNILCVTLQNREITANTKFPTMHITYTGGNENLITLGVFAKLRKATISFIISVSVRLSAWNNWAPSGRIFMKFVI